jgi:hypothetical protein
MSDTPPEVNVPSLGPPDFRGLPVIRYENQLAQAGLVFVGLSFICILAVVVKTVAGGLSHTAVSPTPDDGRTVFLQLLRDSGPNLMLIITGFIAALIGRALLRAGQRATYSSLPEGDLEILRDAVRDGKSDPIDQYIRLRALTGFTGGFTKIGLTGLPLVTIGVTLIFIVLSLIFFQNEKVFTSLFDLAKLTLGAFIGSYVQRQVERRRQEGEASPPSSRDPSLPA